MPARSAHGAKRHLARLDPAAGQNQPEHGTESAATTTAPAPRPAPELAPTRAFSARLDPETDERFERLTRGLRDALGLIGRRPVKRGEAALRTGYPPSRVDLLRALLAVADNEPAVLARVQEQVRRDLTDE